MVATKLPIKISWQPEKDPEPWGCILAEDDGYGYCDQCPAEEICPHDHKEFSQ